MHIRIYWEKICFTKRPGVNITIQHEMMNKFGLRREMNINGVSEYDVSEETWQALQKAIKNKLIKIL